MAIKDLTKISMHLFMCNGGSCRKRGSEASTLAIRDMLERLGLSDQVHTTKTMCNGRCNDGPIVISMPQGLWFKRIDEDTVETWMESFIVKNQPKTEHLLFAYGNTEITDTHNGE